MPKLAYIGGYGHSGSTLLEYMMTINPSIIGFGEVVNFLTATKQRKCTCGRLVDDCLFWGIFSKGRSLNSSLNHTQLIEALLRKVSGDYKVATDSSKTAWGTSTMPFRLRHRLGEDFLLIHLVRDPRGVSWSNIQRRMSRHKSVATQQDSKVLRPNKTLECCRTALGWWVANLSCEAFKWMYPEQYIRVRYEDFSNFPEKVLDNLFERLLPTSHFVNIESGESWNRHQLFGNRVRRKRLSVGDIKEDVLWTFNMPGAYRSLVLRLCYPLRKLYGYS